MLSLEGSRKRLGRFKAALDENGVDIAVLSDSKTIYYLTGHWSEEEFPQLLVTGPGRSTTLITFTEPSQTAADTVQVYESYSVDWPPTFAGIVERAAKLLRDTLNQISKPVRKLAVEKARLNVLFFEILSARWPSADLFDGVSILRCLRRRKDADEIALIRKCAEVVEAGFTAARGVIRPGATELAVFNEVHGEIVKLAGYNLKFNGDFACGMRAIKGGGTPLNRPVLPGDLYILDIYPSFHGYYADLCRTFAASGPTSLQLRAWEICHNALQLAEQIIRPGVSTRDVWNQLRSYVDSFEFVRGSFWHHAGHGIGLEAQEFPWIIPGSDHIFEAGDVIAVEPGCYSEALQGGVRLECDYLVGTDGLENLAGSDLEVLMVPHP